MKKKHAQKQKSLRSGRLLKMCESLHEISHFRTVFVVITSHPKTPDYIPSLSYKQARIIDF